MSFQNCTADQDKKHRQVWYRLGMQALLVVHFMVMSSLVLCLLDVLHFVSGRREEIYLGTE